MTLRNACMTFVTAFAIIIGLMLGMSALIGVEVETARFGGGYGIAAQL